MTQLKIHGGNMAFHKRVAISVQISSWEGGNVVYASAPGTSYSLNRLPIGSKIVKASDSLYNITDSSSTVLGSITLTADSGYVIGGIKLNGQLVSSTPVTLNDGDILNPIFTMITMRIKFYDSGLGTFYNELTSQYIYDGGYADVPRADELRFKPYSTANGIIEIYKDGLWIPVIDYAYNGQQAYIIAAPASAQVQSVEFVTDGGNTYTFPALWGLQSGYQYLDGSTFAFKGSPTPACDLVDYQTAGWTSPTDKSGDIRNALQQFVSQYGQFQDFQAMDPGNFSYEYILYDGDRSCCGLAYGDLRYIYYDPQSGQGYSTNTAVIVAFFDAGSDLYATPYELYPSGQYQVLPQWSNTSLNDPRNFIGQTFKYGDKNVLGNWMTSWQCGDVCGLIQIIYSLATNK